jgi:cytohesin
MKLLLITTIATMPLMGYGRPAQESEATPVPQILAQKPQQIQETKTEESEISIHRAAWEGDTKAIEQHLAACKDVNAKDDLYGDTPLLWAAGFGHKGVVEMLITKGADVNAKAEGGWTPLHYATGGNDKEIVELLIAKGADLNAKNARDQITPLHWAAWRDHKEITELLIAKGAGVNTKNKSGGTPLHNATWKGHKEIVELLIAKGADLNAKDVDGETPLNWAEEGKHKEITDLLRKHGGKSGEELKAAGK